MGGLHKKRTEKWGKRRKMKKGKKDKIKEGKRGKFFSPVDEHLPSNDKKTI